MIPRMKVNRILLASGLACTWALFLGIYSVGPAHAQQESTRPAAELTPQQKENFDHFKNLLSGARLVGTFTVIGGDNELREEEYLIEEVTKLDKGDYWKFKARIKYGGKEFSAPLPLQVKWAGDTPVITLTDFTIPGMGTFSSRVLFYKGKYAGTWSHGDTGGHLFGRIVPASADNEAKSSEEEGDLEEEEKEAKPPGKQGGSDR